MISMKHFNSTYRIKTILKVETDIIAIISVRQGRAGIFVILSVEAWLQN